MQESLEHERSLKIDHGSNPAPTQISSLATTPTSLLDRARGVLALEGGALAFVWLVWLVQVWLLLDCIAENGLNFPLLDEWEMIPVLTGHQDFTLAWLWSQHNEHRIVIPRLIYLLLAKLTGSDFRAGMVFDALTLSGACAALVVTARNLRGRQHWADAFFPLLLLHFGQMENILWSIQIVFVSSSVMAMVVLCALLRPGKLTRKSAVVAGVCSLLLPLFGGNGVGMAPAFSLLTLALAWELRRDPTEPRRSWHIVGGLGLGSIAMTMLYFIGFQKNEGHPESPSLKATIDGILQVLSLGWGSASKMFWPLNQHLALGVLVATATALIAILVRNPAERTRAVRLALFMGGVGSLAAGIAWARVGLYPLGIASSRYATLVAPLFCAAFFVWQLVASPQLARFAQMMMFMFAALMLFRNRDVGKADMLFMRVRLEAPLNDLRNKVPVDEIARRYCGTIYLCAQIGALHERMIMLREHKIGDWANANPN